MLVAAVPSSQGGYGTRINASRRRRKHPNQQDVPPQLSHSFTCSCLTHGTRGRCNCELFPLVKSTSFALNVSKVSWGDCTSFGVESTDSNFRCGFLEVPMDYHDSSAGAASLAVIKYAATVPEKKGTVFFNPGDALHPLSEVLS